MTEATNRRSKNATAIRPDFRTPSRKRVIKSDRPRGEEYEDYFGLTEDGSYIDLDDPDICFEISMRNPRS